jgi:uncharacterized membrane protein YbhN (UPF0104 family)
MDQSPSPLPETEVRSAVMRARFQKLGTLASAILFVASLVVLWHIVSDVGIEGIRNALANANREQLLIAAGFTALSYLFLTFYDVLALRQLQITMPYRTTALGSYTSFAISFTLGFPLITAATVRYWIYSRHGVSAAKVASITLIAGVTFWLGMALVIAFGLLAETGAIGGLNHLPSKMNQLIGVAVLAVILFYLVWVAQKRRAVRVQKWLIELPNLKVTLVQLALGAADVCAAATVLYVLLPAGHNIEFPMFAAVYAFACILGIASHAPGGLGVFEATMLLAFSWVPQNAMLGALFLFRVIYYLAPFMVALALLGAYEIARHLKTYREREAQEGE